MVDMCHYTFVKTHTMYTKSEPQGKLWTLGDYSVSTEQMYHLYDIGNRIGLFVWSRTTWKCLYFCSVCCELETALNNKVYFLKFKI